MEHASLFGSDQKTLENFFTGIDQKPFHSSQLIKWIHQRGEMDFSSMTDFSLKLRSYLTDYNQFELPTVHRQSISDDGVVKWLFKLYDDNIIETVFIPEPNRGTLCISSQVGCYLNCSFCATALQGFNRNLSSGEIISQLWLARDILNRIEKSLGKSPEGLEYGKKITNVVFMGMGEPLLNVKQVIPAANLMLDDNAYGLSKNKVTISTAGLAPQISAFSKDCKASLALSLHSAIDETRNILVPLNNKYPIKSLMESCWDYVKQDTRRHVLFEYVMLKGVNDDCLHVQSLIKLLGDFPAKVNLIPFNPYPGLNYECSSRASIEAFQKQLRNANINTTIRKTRGTSIKAACGQLAGEVIDRTKRIHQQKINFMSVATLT